MSPIDTMPSRIHEIDMRPRPVKASESSQLGRILLGILLATALVVAWFVFSR